MGVIYGIENLIDHKIYVGQTIVKLETRIAKHKSADTLLGRAIRKYGWDGNFIYITLEECETREQLNEREIYWIKKLNSKYPNGYNLNEGGGGNLGYPCSEEAKAKISAANSNPPEAKLLRISDGNKGNTYNLGRSKSEETKHILSERTKAYWVNRYDWKYAYPVLEEELKKQGISHSELARCLNMNRGTMLNKLSGRSGLYERDKQAIMEILNVDMSIEELFKRADS